MLIKTKKWPRCQLNNFEIIEGRTEGIVLMLPKFIMVFTFQCYPFLQIVFSSSKQYC